MIINNPIDKLPRNDDGGTGKTASLRAHINAMCAHCMGCTPGHMERGFREAIRGCTAPQCPLWPVRPYQEKRS